MNISFFRSSFSKRYFSSLTIRIIFAFFLFILVINLLILFYIGYSSSSSSTSYFTSFSSFIYKHSNSIQQQNENPSIPIQNPIPSIPPNYIRPPIQIDISSPLHSHEKLIHSSSVPRILLSTQQLSPFSTSCLHYGLGNIYIDSFGSICTFSQIRRKKNKNKNNKEKLDEISSKYFDHCCPQSELQFKIQNYLAAQNKEKIHNFNNSLSSSTKSISDNNSTSSSSKSPSPYTQLSYLLQSKFPSSSYITESSLFKCPSCNREIKCCENIESCIQCCMKKEIIKHSKYKFNKHHNNNLNDKNNNNNSSLSSSSRSLLSADDSDNQHTDINSFPPLHHEYFTYCLSQCRTSSLSIIHGNHYKFSHLPFCYVHHNHIQSDQSNNNNQQNNKDNENNNNNNKNKNSKLSALANSIKKGSNNNVGDDDDEIDSPDDNHIHSSIQSISNPLQSSQSSDQPTSDWLSLSSVPFELSRVKILISPQGHSCDSVCRDYLYPNNNYTCFEPWLPHINNCDIMKQFFTNCKTCENSGGADQPAFLPDNKNNIKINNDNNNNYFRSNKNKDNSNKDNNNNENVLISSVDSSGRCLLNNNPKLYDCDGHHEDTMRLCPCVNHKEFQPEKHSFYS